MFIMNRIQELEALIEKHKTLYYEGTPEQQEAEGITDAEFDALEDELRELDPTNPMLEKVGATQEEGRAKLSVPMLSQEKALSEEEALKFLSRYPTEEVFVMTEKLDGAGLDLKYEDGKLVEAITRGDWESGSIVTLGALHTRGIPHEIDCKDTVHIRGEVVIEHADFEKINEQREVEGKKTFANCRNLAAGTIKLSDVEELKKRPMHFISYDVFPEGNFFGTVVCLGIPNSYKARLKTLKNLGFSTPVVSTVYVGVTKKIVSDAFHFMESQQLPYDIDGMVVRLDDIHYSESLGATGHHWRMSFAIKPKAEAKEVVVDHIDWTMSRLGTVTPTAVFKPTLIGGAEISRANVHNLNNMERLNICPGTKIKVVRSGLVIPKIIGSDKKTMTVDYTSSQAADRSKEEIDMVNAGYKIISRGPDSFKCYNPNEWRNWVPEVDPTTKAPLKIVELTEDGSRILRVADVSSNYFAVAKKIEHFLKAIRVLGWGETLLAEYCQNSGIVTIKEFVDLLSPVSVMNHISSRNISLKYATSLVDVVKDKVKAVELLPFLQGLGIARAQEILTKIAPGIKKKEDLFNFSIWEKNTTPGVYAYIHEDLASRKAEILDLFDSFNVIFTVKEEKQESDKLVGKVFVITGTLSKPRKHFEGLVKSNGGTIGSSVSKNTSYLLAGEDCGSKLSQAQKLGVPVLTEEEFNSML